ncbi:MAG: hypothetical protein AAFQ98_25090 [Bacteroidota bacterium]
MMMNHLGDATHEEYKTAFLSLIALIQDYPWKVSMSNEIWLRHIPTQTRIWAGTRAAFMPGVRRVIQANTEIVNISARNSLGVKLANLFHGMLRTVTGLELNSFQSLEAAFGYLAEKYGTPEVQARYQEQLAGGLGQEFQSN